MQVFKPASPSRKSADQPNRPERSGTRVMPMRATPPPAISCFMPWDFAPGLSLPVYAPLRSAQSRRPPDVVRPSSRLIAPQIPRPAPSATMRVCSTPTALLKKAIDKSSLLDAGELPREMVMGFVMDPRKQKCPRPAPVRTHRLIVKEVPALGSAAPADLGLTQGNAGRRHHE